MKSIEIKSHIEEIEIKWRGGVAQISLAEIINAPHVDRKYIQEIPILGAGGLWCNSKTCPLTRDCTNHLSASDFRNEHGSQPDLYLHDDKVFCDQVSNIEGAYIVLHKGKLVDSDFPAD